MNPISWNYILTATYHLDSQNVKCVLSGRASESLFLDVLNFLIMYEEVGPDVYHSFIFKKRSRGLTSCQC